VDSSDVLGRARREQARFERHRVRLLPATGFAASGGDCDEIVGRFCLWFDDTGDKPVEEPPAIDSLRAGLVAYLDSVQALLPGDGWVLGQRVWYSGEGGRWADALRDARECGGAEPWWCAALEGLSLHGLGRYEEAERAFERALEGMDPEQAKRWREPRRAVQGGVRDVVDDADGDDRADALSRLWTLADPSYLVPGNDRRTEHYARWTVARIRERARNPYQIGWGGDLEELLVRFGWEVGWERARSWNITEAPAVVGHQHPAGREYMPSADAMRDPATAGIEDLAPGGLRRPRSLYAPAYAPVILPMDGQVVVFPRGDRETVVATAFVPADTTRHPGDDWPRPWMEAGDQAGLPDRAGLFLVPVLGRGAILSRTRTGTGEGSLLLEAPAGDYVVSVEAWRPPERVAGRTRMGLRGDTVALDLATLSGLLLVDEGRAAPTSLEEAAGRALVHRAARSGGSVGVVWEINGLGWSPATVTYDLSLEAADRGFFRRIGEGLGLVDRERPLALSWDEPGPQRPAPMLRHLALDLPDVEAGTYRLVLRARITGRTTLESSTEIVIDVPH